MKTTQKEELTRVQREDGKCNYIIDANGKLFSEQWYKWIGYFNGDEYAMVQREDGLMNFIDTKGKILSGEWFKKIDYFHCGYARVQREDGKWNFINKQGRLMSNEWFEYISYVQYSEYAFAYADRTNGESCKIDKNGKIVVSK